MFQVIPTIEYFLRCTSSLAIFFVSSSGLFKWFFSSLHSSLFSNPFVFLVIFPLTCSPQTLLLVRRPVMIDILILWSRHFISVFTVLWKIVWIWVFLESCDSSRVFDDVDGSASLARGQTADVLTRSACHFRGPDVPQRTGTIVSSYRTVGSKVTVNCRWPGKLRIAVMARRFLPMVGISVFVTFAATIFLSLALFLSFSFSFSLSSTGDPCLRD